MRTLARAVAQAYFDARRTLGFPMADDVIREEVEAELKKQDEKAAKKAAKKKGEK